MNSRTKTFLIFGYIFFTFTTCLFGNEINLVKNPSFEEGKIYWSTFSNHNPDLVFRDDAAANDGDFSVKLGGTTAAENLFIDCVQAVPLKPLTKYRLKIDIKRTVTIGFITAAVLERRVSGEKENLHEVGPATKKGANIWEHFEEEFVTQDKIYESFVILYNETNGIAWFDNIQLIEISDKTSSLESKGENDYHIKYLNDPLKIDGVLNEFAWEKSDLGTNFTVFPPQSDIPILAVDQTSFRMLFDEKNLYLGVICEESNKNKMVGSEKRDGNLWREDSMEIFIRPSVPEDIYAHFIINRKSAYYDALSKNGQDNALWNINLETATQETENGWTAEIRIPLKDIEILSPSSGEIFLNIARNNFTDGGILSTWSIIKPPATLGFQDPASFRKAYFRKEKSGPRIVSHYPDQRNAGIILNPEFLPDTKNPEVLPRWKISDTATWLPDKSTVSSAKVDILAVQKISLLNIADKTFEVVAYYTNPRRNATIGLSYLNASNEMEKMEITLPEVKNGFAEKVIPVKFPETAKEIREVTVFTTKPGEFAISFLQMTNPEMMRFAYTVSGYENVEPNQAYFSPCIPIVGISNEITVPLMWTTGQSFTDKRIWGDVYAEDSEKPLDKNFVVYIDVPEGVEITKLGGEGSGFPGQKDQQTQKVKRGSEQYQRHTISLAWLSTRPYITCLKSTLKPGEQKTGYYRLSWNGGQSAEEQVIFKETEIPIVTRPKKFVTGLFLYPLVANDDGTFPEKGDILTFKKMGINLVGLCKWGGFNEVQSPRTNFFIETLKKENFWVSVMFDPLAPFSGRDEPEGLAYDFHGKPMEGTMCPSYRGNSYLREFQRIREAAKRGISWIVLDWENYNYQSDRVCFCNRCKEGFKSFLQKKYPDLTYADPSLVIQNRNAYLDLFSAWQDYKNTLIEKWLAESKKVLEERARENNSLSSPQPYLDLCVSEHAWDFPRLLNGPINHIGIMRYAYYGEQYGEPVVRSVGIAIADDFKKFGSKKHTMIPILSPGERDGKMVFPRKGIKYQILEAAASQSAGFLMYYNEVMDAEAYRYLAEAIGMIEPIENILLDGQCLEIPMDNKDFRVVRFNHPDGIVYFVSEYSMVPAEVSFEQTFERKFDITDVETKGIVGSIGPGKTKFTVKLDKERVRMFLLRPAN